MTNTWTTPSSFPALRWGDTCSRCTKPIMDGELLLIFPNRFGSTDWTGVHMTLHCVHLSCCGPQVASAARGGLGVVSSGAGGPVYDSGELLGTRALTAEEHEKYNAAWEAEQDRLRDESRRMARRGGVIGWATWVVVMLALCVFVAAALAEVF